jgi:hypothetical protein
MSTGGPRRRGFQARGRKIEAKRETLGTFREAYRLLVGTSDLTSYGDRAAFIDSFASERSVKGRKLGHLL